MHGSLILPESGPDISDEMIHFHNRDYFNLNVFYPEVSGLYEVIVSNDSPYRQLIDMRIFIPLIYFDKKENVWIHHETNVDINKIGVIGWREF